MRQPVTTFAFPKLGRGVAGLMIALVVCYVVEMLALRAGAGWIEPLFLVPAQVIRGFVWQPFTYIWFHSPGSASHLLFNLLLLYWFGTAMETWWGTRRLLTAYLIYGVSGGVFTVLVALLIEATPLRSSMGMMSGVHLGASGALMGVTVAWGLVHANQRIRLLLLPEMTGKNFILLLIGVELLTALSFDSVSVTSHFGGLLAAVVLAKGLWRPSRWQQMFRRRKLERQRARIEHELRIIEGGKKDDDPKMWN